jgi:hypothetical protein
VDALLKLREVKSARPRCPTLLHFVAREAARQHPGGASLAAELPSAGAAAALDPRAPWEQLRQLTADVAGLERLIGAAQQGATSLEGSGACLSRMAAWGAEALDLLASTRASWKAAEGTFRWVQWARGRAVGRRGHAMQRRRMRMSAQACCDMGLFPACSQLGASINGQRATLADPAAFFGVLRSFAAELDAAHEENEAADAAAAGKPADGSLKRAGEALRSVSGGGSPAGSAASTESLRSRRRRSVREGSSWGEPGRAAAGEMSAARPGRRQHSPSPVLSEQAVAGLGGSRRGVLLEDAADEHAQGAGAGGSGGPAQGMDLLGWAQLEEREERRRAPARLSTPVASLLAESARLISSVEGGFGSVVNAGGDSGGDPSGRGASEGGAAPEAGAAAHSLIPDSPAPDAAFSTPRRSETQPWQEQAAAAGGAQAGRHAAAAGGEAEGNAAAAQALGAHAGGPPAAVLAARASVQLSQVGAGRLLLGCLCSPACHACHGQVASFCAAGNRGARRPLPPPRAPLLQMRQRSLQHLSPTSTPLSSLGRQSSRGSMPSSGASTPGTGARQRAALLRNSSPLGAGGAGAAVLEAEAASAAAAARRGIEAAAAPTLHDATAARPAFGNLIEVSPLGAEAWQPAEPPLQAFASDSDDELAPAAEAAGAEGEDALHLQARGIVPMHSRAGSFDLTFYAPFSAGQGAFDGPLGFDGPIGQQVGCVVQAWTHMALFGEHADWKEPALQPRVGHPIVRVSQRD